MPSMPLVSRTTPTIPAGIALPVLFATNGLFLGAWIASIPNTTARLELSRNALGTILPAFPLGGLVAFIFAAVLMRRIGSRWSIVGFGLLRAAAFPLLAVASSDATLAVSLALVGLAHGGLDVSLNAQGVERERQLGRPILARAHAAYSVGTLTGSLGFGLIEQPDTPLLPLFVVPSLIGAAMFLLLHRSLVADLPSPPAATSQHRQSRRLGLNVVPYALGIVLAIAFVTEIADEAICDWFALYLREELQSLPAAASLDYSVYAFAILVGRVFGDAISSRVPPMRLLQYCGAVGGAGILIGAGVNTTAAMLVGTAITGLGYSLILPTLYRIAGSLPEIAPATALAMVATAVYLGYMVGPLVIGPVSDATSLQLALLGVGALFFVVPVLAWKGAASAGKRQLAPT